MSNANILNQLSWATTSHRDWSRFAPYLSGDDCSYGVHIAVMVEPFLGYILDGTKTIETRFSKNLIPPYRRITPGDLVLLKAGPVVAAFCASSVECVDLNDDERTRLRRDYSKDICADDAFWKSRDDRNYATLIGIDDVQKLTPVSVPKHDRRGWLVVRSPRDSGQGQLTLM